MTLTSDQFEEQYVLTSPDQTLGFAPFFLLETDLKVSRTDQSPVPVVTVLVLGTDYTVTGAGNELGGDVTMTGSVTLTGDTITVQRCPPCSQLVKFDYNERFPARVNEKAHDKAMMLICKLLGVIFGPNARVLRYPDTEFGTNNVVPIKKDRLGTIWFWDPITGEPGVIAPGSLDLALLLHAESDLGGATPDNTNGATQKAIKCYIDAADFILRTLIDNIITAVCLNPDGTFNASLFAGSNFLGCATSICTAFLALDEEIKINRDAIDGLDGRVTALEAGGGFTFRNKTIKSGSGSIALTHINLKVAPFNVPDSARKVYVHFERDSSTGAQLLEAFVKGGGSTGGAGVIAIHRGNNSSAVKQTSNGLMPIVYNAATGETFANLLVNISGTPANHPWIFRMVSFE